MTLIVLALAYIIGIVLGSLAWQWGILSCDVPAWLWTAPLALLPWTPLLNSPPDDTAPLRWPVHAGFTAPQPWLRRGTLAALGLCMAAGMLRYAAQPLHHCLTPADLADWNLPAEASFDPNAPQVRIEGAVTGFPVVEEGKQELVVAATAIQPLDETGTTSAAAQSVAGLVRIKTAPYPRFEYGDPVRASGRLVAPPVFEDFSYRDYLARKGIQSTMQAAEVVPRAGPPGGKRWRRVLMDWRSRGLALLNRNLPEPYAGLAAGILLGVDAGIPEPVYDRFNATGTSHVLVISGSNVALIAGLFLVLGRRLFGRWAPLPALSGIGLYALLVGGDASVARAALMGALVVLAAWVDRRSTALVGLAAAAWAMALFNPHVLWDVGFQLSAAATAGLILCAPRLTAWLAARWPWLQDGLLTGASTDTSTGAENHTASPAYSAGPTYRAGEVQDGVDAVPGYSLSNLGDRNLRSQSLAAVVRGVLVDGGVMTLAASLFTLPLVAYHFERLSVVGMLINLLIVPVQPLILLSGTAGLVVGVLGLSWAATPILWIAWLGLVWTERLVTWAAALPGASVSATGFGLGPLLLTYALIVLILFGSTLLAQIDGAAPVRWWARLQSDAVQPAVWGPVWGRVLTGNRGLGALVTLTVLVWSAVWTLPDGRLHLYFLDVGQGDGILVETPGGRQVLIDGGAGSEQLLAELGEVMPFWDRRIDVLLLTHPDRDHVGGLQTVPDRFDVQAALDTAASQTNEDAANWRAELEEAGVPVTLQYTGGWVDLGDGVALWVLWPQSTPYSGGDADNENSLVTKLVYGDFSVLLTGDAGVASERVWLAQGLAVEADVLKVGHHGSTTSTSAAFVEAVTPEWAVIQVGEDNRYGHPADLVLQNLAETTLLRTDRHGRIHMATNGQQLWVETEHGDVQTSASVQ